MSYRRTGYVDSVSIWESALIARGIQWRQIYDINEKNDFDRKDVHFKWKSQAKKKKMANSQDYPTVPTAHRAYARIDRTDSDSERSITVCQGTKTILLCTIYHPRGRGKCLSHTLVSSAPSFSGFISDNYSFIHLLVRSFIHSFTYQMLSPSFPNPSLQSSPLYPLTGGSPPLVCPHLM